ncbi:TerC family protein [Bordetella sp. FB-8]|uniref:TerC family protein n=1 Tax=Bordetella sp. FB-8 TaxID=1159870 RepID=UPI00036FDC94|nr:TerC family protein [Bordetella sp. FB-8]
MLEFFQTMSWAAVLQIIAIDLLLGGDNAVVIALACRHLEPAKRLQGILWGTAGAIVLRVVLVAFALTLLDLPLLKLVGGLLLLWIGVKLMLPEDGAHEVRSGASVVSAVKTIIVADFVMSLDNVVAISGAAESAHPAHQLGLVVFGLLISIPIIVWGSTLVLRLIDRLPVVILLGAALLGWIAGGMMVDDAFLISRIGEAPEAVKIGVEICGAMLVVLLGRWLARCRAVVSKDATS